MTISNIINNRCFLSVFISIIIIFKIPYSTIIFACILSSAFFDIYVKDNLPNILGVKNIYKVITVFLSTILCLHILLKLINFFVKFDCPRHWPISVFSLGIRTADVWLITAVVLILFAIFNAYPFQKIKFPHLILIAIIFILGTNCIQGGKDGFLKPISGKRGDSKGIEYYYDAINIKDTKTLLNTFNEIQTSLLIHAKVHPPGAVLIIYWLNKLFKGQIIFISISITIIATILSLFFFYKFLILKFDKSIAKYSVFLFSIIPSIQIYYCATIDALVLGCLLGVLYFFFHSNKTIGLVGLTIFTFFASFITFGFTFILPVIFCFELFNRKSILRPTILIFFLGLIYFILNEVFGFNYLKAFITATIIESPDGFRLISDPLNYFLTQIEGIAEILLFFGPFLCFLMFKGLSILKRNYFQLWTLFCIAIGVLFLMFFSGALRTGETARVCLFIYPYLFLPVVAWLANKKSENNEKSALLSAVFIQTIFMQLYGVYLW